MRADLTRFAVFYIFVGPVNSDSRQLMPLHVDRIATANVGCDAKAPIKSYIVTALFVMLRRDGECRWIDRPNSAPDPLCGARLSSLRWLD